MRSNERERRKVTDKKRTHKKKDTFLSKNGNRN